MSESLPALSDLTADDALFVHNKCCAFEAAWKNYPGGVRPVLEDWLIDVPVTLLPALLGELLRLDLEYRANANERPVLADYVDRPGIEEAMLRRVWLQIKGNGALHPSEQSVGYHSSQTVDTPRHEQAADDSPPQPTRIGRYLVQRILGKGGFGIVYLSYDEQLQRSVAIKVPHRKLVDRPEAAEPYLIEARTVASLDHPNIVPVYDAGSAKDCPFFVVSKYIDGTSLARRLRESRLAIDESVPLVATIAEALHYAHKRCIVHRDIKPGNILLDQTGKPFVADFGLALREQDVGKGPRYAGTPPYMSPEQARGEGHRVDGRSDIFSLGVVLYELLTGRRPFKAESKDELFDQIAALDVRPPRQLDDAIPKELERICLKALAKRSSERYSAARDMADDLRHFMGAAPGEEKSTLTPRARNEADAAPAIAPPTPHGSESHPVKIVPKGLRSFDAGDADFFLKLLPGPRDRDGLPESIRFWKTRIETTDADSTFSVGLLYGPSGCGKSSLVKAGLLPRLARSVTVVYIEATGDGTEARLLKGLRRQVPAIPGSMSLTESLAAVRQGRYLNTGQKVLLVLDQFEQWLHAKRGAENTELVHALRQCDGGRLQAIVMVRDDFGMAATRFTGTLDSPIVQGNNFATVDLFDLLHARKVLAAFGRAYGRLPNNLAKCSKEQEAFLDQAVSGLAQDGRIVSVRLALFAEMVKGKPWSPATLKHVGGTEGVGVTFLDETFTASSAPPQHRLHHLAAQSVLKALLPEAGTDIKGHMRSHAELLAASGYGTRLRDFDDLLRILDGELRLITPTEADADGPSLLPGDLSVPPAEPPAPPPRCYQLTHDYLVPSLREWLTRKQKETRRGRAELQLAESSALWNARPLNRNLPSSVEWLRMRLLTRSRRWTAPERKMMRQTDRYYLVRCLLLTALVGIVAWGLWEHNQRVQAESLRERLLSADMAEMPAILTDLAGQRRHVEPLLRRAFEEENDAKKRLRLALALVEADRGQVPFLYEQMLQAPPQEFAVIRQVLAPHQGLIRAALWKELTVVEPRSERCFRAAFALVDYATDDPRWPRCASLVVDGLIARGPQALSDWRTSLGAVKAQLLPALASSLEDPRWAALERRMIIECYRSVAGGHPDGMAPLRKRLAIADAASPSGPDQARRKATILAALAALGEADDVWPALVHTADPTLRSYLIERIATSGVDPERLTNRLQQETDPSIRRAVILASAAYPRSELTAVLARLYANDPDPGVHAAVGWVLRSWHEGQHVDSVDDNRAPGPVASRSWFVNTQRQTFSIVVAPARVIAKAPAQSHDSAHRYAISATEVTVSQFRAFRPDFKVDDTVAASPQSPVNQVSWHDAAEYCNWLTLQDGMRETDCCYRAQPGGKGLMEVEPDYRVRCGYRLPTELEWEFACRAGAETRWSFGAASDELASQYAWWFGNGHDGGNRRAFPVASLKPNDLGLFDMHGNLNEWCLDSTRPQGALYQDDVECGTRGGSYLSLLPAVACDNRLVLGRKIRGPNVSFRVCQSLPSPAR